VARLADPSSVGVMVFNLAIIVVISVLATLGHNIATMRQFALSPYDQHSYKLLRRSSVIVFITALLIYVCLNWFGRPLFEFLTLDATSQKVTKIYILAIIPASLLLLLAGYFKGVGRPGAAILSDIGTLLLCARIVDKPGTLRN
jgi:O-antigen/teichoic acid export membrane protein